MDDFIDQMLSTPQWAEGRWANPESLQGLPKLTSMSLMPMSYSGSFETQQQVVVGGNMELQSLSLWHHHLSSMPSQGFSQQQDLKPVETMQLGKRCRSDDVEAAISGGNMTDQVCSPSTPQNPNGGAKPRVRARRGQATDPHSIAERNRRERIAERMKSLQELVPDANKTDKASMLDEIITYIRFLQMQVKCLSACRLGGAGVAATDLIAESASNFMAATLSQSNGVTGSMQDGMVFVERQVARLMDEDMSLAMQYLQSKGLCLMPISLATAISGATPQRQSRATEDDGMEKQQSEANGQCMIMEAFGTRAPPIYETNFTEQGAGGTPKTPIPRDEINCEKTIFGAFENN